MFGADLNFYFVDCQFLYVDFSINYMKIYWKWLLALCRTASEHDKTADRVVRQNLVQRVKLQYSGVKN